MTKPGTEAHPLRVAIVGAGPAGYYAADHRRHYHQILYSTGAQTDRRMGIPGEDLKGSHPATEFVAWYNGHPDYRDCQFDLSQERAAVVGVGNVAIDVARILCRSAQELATTDIADYALEALRRSRIKEVYLLGRPGSGGVHQPRGEGGRRASRRRRHRAAGGGGAGRGEPGRRRAEPGPRHHEEGADPARIRGPEARREVEEADHQVPGLTRRALRQRGG